MRTITTVFLALAFTLAVVAQGYKFEIDTQTPEGQLLQKAGQASSDADKIAAYEEFLAKYPQHPGVVYAWNQVQPLHLKAGALDKVITAAAAILP